MYGPLQRPNAQPQGVDRFSKSYQSIRFSLLQSQLRTSPPPPISALTASEKGFSRVP